MEWKHRHTVVYTAAQDGFVLLVHGAASMEGEEPSTWHGEVFTEDGGRVCLMTTAESADDARGDCETWVNAAGVLRERDPYPRDAVHR